jgi:hypothetical protein
MISGHAACTAFSSSLIGIKPKQGNETLEDKVLRMIQNEMDFSNTGFQNGLSCGTMSLPQMSRPA